MSGNVSQMIGLLEMCLTSMGHEIQPGTVLFATIAAVNAVHKVYSSMQVQEWPSWWCGVHIMKELHALYQVCFIFSDLLGGHPAIIGIQIWPSDLT